MVDDCIDYTVYDSSVVNVMMDLENNYGCSGVCEPYEFYLFTDVTT
jgi:hypothetical protein